MSHSSVPPDIFREGSSFGFDRGRSIPEADPMVVDPGPDQGATTGGQQASNLSGTHDSDSFSDLYASAVPSRAETPVQMDVDPLLPTSAASNLDLANRVKGMYRILDLISEQGSGGLVAKIVIAQESLRAFINTISPNSYSATTKVNFQALDKLTLKPMGIYGNKEEIATFFIELGIIDRATAELLCKPHDTADVDEPVLRSGLYIIRSSEMPRLQEQVFVVYWPEDTTWNDSAASSVRRNRVTFMRYLTKVADQVSALISPSYASRLVWNDDNHDDPVDTIEDEDMDAYEESGRLFTYQVAKTNEQEESVTTRPGFTVTSALIRTSQPHDSPVDSSVPMPQLLPGETVQGLMMSTFIPAKKVKEPLSSSTQNGTQIKNLIETNAVGLAEDLTSDALDILAKLGLKLRFPQACKAWIEGKADIIRVFKDRGVAKNIELGEQLDSTLPQLSADLREAVVSKVTRLYPFFTPEEQELPEDLSQVEPEVTNEGSKERLENLASLYPKMASAIDKAIRDVKLDTIKAHKYNVRKTRLLVCWLHSQRARDASAARSRLFNSILDAKDNRAVRKILDDFTPEKDQATDSKPSFWSSLNPFTSSKGDHTLSYAESLYKEAERIASAKTDAEFLSGLDTFIFALEDDDLLSKVDEIKSFAKGALQKSIAHVLKTLPHTTLAIQQEDCRRQIEMEVASEQQKAIDEARSEFIHAVNQAAQSSFSARIFINHIETSRTSWGTQDYYKVIGSRESTLDAAVEFAIYQLQLTTEHRHNVQLDPTFIPTPTINQYNRYAFRLPLSYRIRLAQLLENDRMLLILDNGFGIISVYLESLTTLDGAIGRQKVKKTLQKEKIGKDFSFAFDETKRMLAVCSSSHLSLYIYVFDAAFTSLSGLGTVLNLVTWFTPGTAILHACFVSGEEEILLIDSMGQARIFSLITEQFRPAFVQLDSLPQNASSSPDGSCLLISYQQEAGTNFVAYHWSTFGSTNGIPLLLPDLAGSPTVLSSIGNRNSIHLMSINIPTHSCRSTVLDIKRKITEFMFREKGAKQATSGDDAHTMHNCLIDCFRDLWTRFPVVPAIRRRTITSSSTRASKRLKFVTTSDHHRFSPYFNDMIQAFEKLTRKPTASELRSISVSGSPLTSFENEMRPDLEWDVSRICLGEWLADFLCLIPIQIAVCRENRFIPLKDGVFSPELERSLLGAEVTRIVDNLSLGWYESLLQSYMVSKPVKVVSSMGEQSVGKSYALNHLVDTSFAGSAMRTTEGVWMSITPTDDAIVVALDFEGVHSIERSTQEDTLLVLFNTAISNLVLFRNNFALSRDLTSLFHSFQSSSTVLDPAANPSLFQSTLVIIIKDVVESDKLEVQREFALKFQKIVQDEQDANFISRLHAGNLNIIPWPVIESPEFYKLFQVLKKRLDQQVTKHRTAGEFLFTLKTLMAKLKANDWGALSQTLVAHRAQALLAILPMALKTGCSEVDPDIEPLKNFDTDLPVDDLTDSSSHFYLAGPAVNADVRSLEQALHVLRAGWEQFAQRQQLPDVEWVANLTLHLERIVELRVSHVRQWIDSNLSRFQANHASIEELRRIFDSAAVELRANVQLCKIQCASCQLLCVQSRSHMGPHDCMTGSHRCIHDCSFCLEGSGEQKPCGMPAGHSSKARHICAVNAHLCGEPCKLQGKQGCLEGCAKVAGHDDEDHCCAASVHMCGEPCGLRVKMLDGRIFSCGGSCRIASNEHHEQHACDNRLCPMTCQLCKRLCSAAHLHGLEDGAQHLCGEEHSCASLCQVPGVCEIDTAPQSIEATFTGRHETFQYTKYTQVAKRIKCVKVIPAGKLEHPGQHSHSMDKNVFHFCKERCKSCGYYCTLPLGHPQQEHETRHGSMSQTRWAIDGPDGTALELEGHKFSAGDEGAPMMCNLVCLSLGRHVHFDYCRADNAARCAGTDVKHMSVRMAPSPEKAKDCITHKLYWQRMGFKDPYSRDDQANFAKCDSMCSGPEHNATANAPAQPSYCALPMFHQPQATNTAVTGLGYISNDGHQFSCRNPVVMQQAFHVIFAIDRSGSMSYQDRLPLPNAPATNTIAQYSNNRLGAVYSALYSFWSARHTATAGQQAGVARQDAYSVVMFDSSTSIATASNFTSTPDELLATLLPYRAHGGTNFTAALDVARGLMEQHWNTQRTPVLIFLSDGICTVADETVQGICRSAVRLGKPLSLHAVSFGEDSTSSSLRRMAQIAREVQNNAPQDPLLPAAATVASSYSEALDTVRLAETFLGIAESLRKPRGSLLR